MQRRKLFVGLAGLATVLTAGMYVLWPLPRHQPNRVSEENALRLREGMTRFEVESILGLPGDYRTGPTTIVPGSGRMLFVEIPTARSRVGDLWRSDTSEIMVEFKESRAKWASYVSLSRIHQGQEQDLIPAAKGR